MSQARSYGQAEAIWTYHHPGGSFQLEVLSWRIRRSRLDLIDWECRLAPRQDYLAAGQYGQIFDLCAPYDPSQQGGLLRWVECFLTRDSVLESLPRLVQDDYQCEEGPESLAITIGGSCRADILVTAEDQFMSEVRSTNLAVVLARATLQEILSAYGLDSNLDGYDDHPVPILYRYGEPMAWVREILTAREGWFWWDGTTLKVEMGGIDIDGSDAARQLVDQADCKLLRRRRSAVNTYNEVKVQMTSEVKAGTAEPQTGKTLGIASVTLDRPLNNCWLRTKLFSPGSVSPICWLDDQGNYLTPNNETRPSYAGTTKAASVEFGLNPPLGSGPNPDAIPWEAEILGAEHIDELGPYESDFVAHYIDTADQAARYRMARNEPLVVPMVATQAIGMDLGQRWVREQQRKYLSLSVEMVLEPSLRPGTVVGLTCQRHGLNQTKLLVEAQEMRGDATSYTMTLELCRGPQYA